MARKAFFEYVLIHHPAQTTDAQGNDTSAPDTIIPVKDAAGVAQEVTRVLAKDQAQVSTIASRQIPDEYLEKLEEVEIRIRAF